MPPGHVLVVAPPNAYGTMAGIAHGIAAGVRAVGGDARVLELPATVQRLRAEAAEGPAHVVFVSSWAAQAEPVPGVRTLDLFTCPVTVHAVDALHREVHFMPAVRDLMARSIDDPRLRFVFCEPGSPADFAPLLPPGTGHVPVGPCPGPGPHVGGPRPRRRLLVVGAVPCVPGSPGRPVRLHRAVQVDPGPGAAHLHRALAQVEQVLVDGPPGTGVVRALAEALQVPAGDLLGPQLCRLAWGVEFWLQHRRRLGVGRALAGLPVDLVGPGWHDNLQGQPGARFPDPVPFDRLGHLMREYCGVVALGVNWPSGVNDRVHTALDLGVPVLAPGNPCLTTLRGAVHAVAPEAQVHGYDERTGDVHDLAAALLEARPARAWQPLQPVRDLLSWGPRALALLGAPPHPGSPAHLPGTTPPDAADRTPAAA